MEVEITLRRDKRTKNFDRFVAIKSMQHAEGTIYLPPELGAPEEITAVVKWPGNKQ